MTRVTKIILIVLAAFLVGFLLLGIIGKSLINEITEEVSLESYDVVTDVKTGERAANFELQDLDGNINKISDFYGAPLILTFWTTWNQSSADQIKILDDYSSRDTRNLFKIVAINIQEDKSVVANFVKRGGYKVKILLDESGAIGELYNAHNLPAAYFIDKDGVLRDVYIGILSEQMLVEKAEKVIK